MEIPAAAADSVVALEVFRAAQPFPIQHRLAWLKAQLGQNATLVHSALGQPLLRSHPDLHFSLSHCNGAIVYVLARSFVGVDIESVERPVNWRRLATRVLSAAETLAVSSSVRPELAFLRLWTAKEALGKADGRGFQIGFRGLDLSAADWSCAAKIALEKGVFALLELKIPGFVGALALAQQGVKDADGFATL